MLKLALAVLLASSLFAEVFAEDKPIAAAVPPGCGAPGAKFEVKTGEGSHPVSQPEVGKALVYFLEDDSQFGSAPKPTTMAGLDGRWVGATHGTSYFSFSVDPGEHHLCASWQTKVILRQGLQMAAAHFVAAAGSVYYFRVKNTWWRDLGTAGISFEPLDSDEGELLTSTFSWSDSHEKK